MRALLFHCKNYKTKVETLANRPKDIEPEEVNEKEQSCEDCVVALITVEKGDNIKKCCKGITEELTKMSQEVGHNNIVIVPFAHLSKKLADTTKGLEALNCIEETMNNGHRVMRAHFGSHKALLLDIYGHPGNARYREF